MKWYKITEEKPLPLETVLVYKKGRGYLVSDTNFYDLENHWTKDANLYCSDMERMKYYKQDADSIGFFEEFGSKYFFDDPDVYWTELPEPPK